MHRAALGVAAGALSGRYGQVASSHGLPKGFFWKIGADKN